MASQQPLSYAAMAAGKCRPSPVPTQSANNIADSCSDSLSPSHSQSPVTEASSVTASTSSTSLEVEVTPSPETASPSQTIRAELKEDILYLVADPEMHCRNLTRSQREAGVMDNGKRRMCELGLAGVKTADLPTFTASSLEEADVGDRFSYLWATDLVMSHCFVIKENTHDPNPATWSRHPEWCKVGGPEAYMFGRPQRVSKTDAVAKIVNAIRAMVGDPPVTRVPSGEYTNATKIVFLFFDDRNDIKWLSDFGLDLKHEFPNSETRDIQQGALPRQVAYLRTIATGNRHDRCGAKAWFEALGFGTEKLHNGGNDAMWELRGFLAEMVLTDEQRAALWDQGRYLTPILDSHGDVVNEEDEVTAALGTLQL